MTLRQGGVQSVDRALRILETLSDDPEGLPLGKLAEHVGLAPSTTHRLLTALEQRRFALFSREAGVWRIGRQAFHVGAAFARRKTFVTPAIPVMRTLRDATRETVNVGAAEDGDVVIVAQVESREIVRAINRIGGTAPLSSSALGKAILATYDDETLDAHVARHALPRCTGKTLTDPAALRADLTDARARGYAVDRDEHFVGLHCVAAPVFDANGDAIAALSVSGTAARLDAERIDTVGPLVARAAADLTRTLDGAPPSEWRAS